MNEKELLEIIEQAARDGHMDLSLRGYELSILPAEIGQLMNLQKLDISKNQLTTLPAEIGKLTNLQTLDLEGNQLTTLPAEIGKLTNLKKINLSRNQLSSLPAEIGKLTNLQTLDLEGNQLTTLPAEIGKLTNLKKINLGNNQLSSLPTEIGQLTNLRSFDLNFNEFVSLPANIGLLKSLESLDLHVNKLTSIPAEIGNLTDIQTLNLMVNELTNLPVEICNLTNIRVLNLRSNDLTQVPAEIGQLMNLQKLDISKNQLITLPAEIGKLTNLQTLDLRLNELNDLPVEIGKLPDLQKLYIEENPLESPPPEIAEKGIVAIREYFKSLEEEERLPLNEVKVLLVGDGGAGKTSLIKQIFGERFNPNEDQTHGIIIRDWIIEGQNEPVAVHFWDFGGQEIMHATHQFFLSKRSLYVLVLDGRKEEKTEYWLKLIESFGGDSPVLIVLNKIDQNASFEVNRRFLTEKYKGIKGFFRISCAKGEGIGGLCDTLKEELPKVELVRTTWPKSWFDVKTSLQSMETPFINYEHYGNLCRKMDVRGENTQKTLVSFLHDLGVVLHFHDLQLRDVHVLDPKWVTGAVYRIINSRALAESKGILRLDALERILRKRIGQDLDYPRKMHRYIIELMKKFELCYYVSHTHVLVPDLLGVEEPKINFDYTNCLRFVIEYDFLPKSVMARFMVKRHMDIEGNLRWRTGVVLHDEEFESTALIKADEDAKKIFIYVAGPQRRDYFAIILSTFREINTSFEKLKVEEKVPMPDNPKITVTYTHLVRMENKGMKTYLPDGSDEEYDIEELLGNIYVELKNEKEIMRFLDKFYSGTETPETLEKKAKSLTEHNPPVISTTGNIDFKKFIKKRDRKIGRILAGMGGGAFAYAIKKAITEGKEHYECPKCSFTFEGKQSICPNCLAKFKW